MEVEREKKEKLAAARKKLNEYKLNRSGASSWRSNAPAAASSPPADVPLFYQNINSPAGSINIFNPAATNNNVTTSPSYVPETLSTAVPGAPVGRNNETDPTVEQGNLNLFSNAGKINQTENVPLFNPFAALPPSVTQCVEEFRRPDFSENSQVVNPTSQNSTSSGLPSVDSLNDLQIGEIALGALMHQEEQAASGLDNLKEEVNVVAGTSMDFSSSFSQLDDVFASPASKTEFSPSAPTLEATNISENTENTLPSSMSAFTEPNQMEITGNDSIVSPGIPQPDRVNNVSIFQNETVQENLVTQGTSMPVYASSLFGTSSRELDSIFNFGENSQVPFVLPNATAPPAVENTSTITDTENMLHLNPFTTAVQDPEETNVSFQAPSQLFGGNVSSESNVHEYNSSSNEMTLNSEIHNSLANELSRQDVKFESENVEHNAFQEIENDSGPVFPAVQISPSTDEKLNVRVTSDELLLLQSEAPPSSDAVAEGNMQQMQSVQEALELQIEELRRENTYLLNRQTELTNRIEESEKLAHEFKLEKDRVREEATNTSQALRARINSLCEENQRIVKNSTDIGVDLRVKMEEKSKQLEEMQKAVIIVSQSKMDFAVRLDHELEQVKELQKLVKEKEDELVLLRTENSDLREKLKQDHQRDAIINQLQDQTRHYQVQCETLQRELTTLKNKLKNQQVRLSSENLASDSNNVNECDKACDHSINASEDNAVVTPGDGGDSDQNQQHSGGWDDHSLDISSGDLLEKGQVETKHAHNHECESHDHSDHHHSHEHGKDSHHHTPEGDHHHHHPHVGDHGHQHHTEGHGHSHNHDHNGEDHHHHNHDHDHGTNEMVVARRGPSDELTELKKTMHRLEWENSSFRNEIDVLAVDAKQKRAYEEKCSALEEENKQLRREVEQLEHVIIQLQGENDTIGDYITLYQTQKMALKECAKEKDAQLELLAREREMLLHRLAELTALVKDLKESKSEAGSQCADDHTHTLDAAIHLPPHKRQIEGKIRDLLSEISSSSLIENFHPCAVCSGRLMTV